MQGILFHKGFANVETLISSDLKSTPFTRGVLELSQYLLLLLSQSVHGITNFTERIN